MSRIVFMILLVLSISTSATAQCVLNDGSGSSLSFTINGEDPSDHSGHLVPVTGLAVSAEITGTPGTHFYLIASATPLHCGAIPANAVVDQIDLLAPVIIQQGMLTGTTTYTVNFSASVQGTCFAPSAQVVTYDPILNRYTATDAAQVCFVPKTVTSYSDFGDDAFQMHTLTQSGADAIVYGGTSYTDVYLGSNGQVTFNDGDTDFSPTPAEFFAGFQTAPTTNPMPGVATYWGDFARASALSDYIEVCEDGLTGEITITYGNQEWWDSQTSAGTWTCAFGTNTVTLDLGAALPGVGGTDQDPIVGVSDGTDQVGTDSTVDLSAVQGTYTSPGTDDSVMEDFTGAHDLTVITFTDVAGTFTWAIN